jgi:hypothetical protein
MTIKKPRVPYLPCPHCEQRLIARRSIQFNATLREIDFSCDNPDCLASFVAQIVIVRQLQPSLSPNLAIILPQGTPRRRPANDDLPAPANDLVAAPPPAETTMSG